MSKLAVFKSNRAQRPSQHQNENATHNPQIYEEGSKTNREKGSLRYTAKEHMEYLQQLQDQQKHIHKRKKSKKLLLLSSQNQLQNLGLKQQKSVLDSVYQTCRDSAGQKSQMFDIETSSQNHVENFDGSIFQSTKRLPKEKPLSQNYKSSKVQSSYIPQKPFTNNTNNTINTSQAQQQKQPNLFNKAIISSRQHLQHQQQQILQQQLQIQSYQTQQSPYQSQELQSHRISQPLEKPNTHYKLLEQKNNSLNARLIKRNSMSNLQCQVVKNGHETLKTDNKHQKLVTNKSLAQIETMSKDLHEHIKSNNNTRRSSNNPKEKTLNRIVFNNDSKRSSVDNGMMRVKIDLETSMGHQEDETMMKFMHQTDDVDEAQRAQKIKNLSDAYNLRDSTSRLNIDEHISNEQLFNQLRVNRIALDLHTNKSSACNFTGIDYTPAMSHKPQKENMFVLKQSLDEHKENKKIYDYSVAQQVLNSINSHKFSDNVSNLAVQSQNNSSKNSQIDEKKQNRVFLHKTLFEDEVIQRESPTNKILHQQVKCMNCQLEQQKHYQTKQALDKAIQLSNILMSEITKLDAKLADMKKTIDRHQQINYAPRPDASQFKESMVSSSSNNIFNKSKSSKEELRSLTRMLKESRKSIHNPEPMCLIKNPRVIKNLSQSPQRNDSELNLQQEEEFDEDYMQKKVMKLQEDGLEFRQNIQQMMNNFACIKNRRQNADSIIRNAGNIVQEIMETSGSITQIQSPTMANIRNTKKTQNFRYSNSKKKKYNEALF
ncbi:UNKNOWN [Stylonychia lemnae]|uniref:Uncharacterized protein n=1 Tax=Stylonychia lemnae TaxID=5949 RepID=A0A078B2K2_STYLE|nr:UNKNOWN [Stylonychia lemnae]|eukprot:CDW87708.1 UNKNOWN [Stylonychia lemnae]